MRRVFGIPGFPRLFAGLTTSMFGDSVMLLVLSIWVKTLTGSNAQAGLTFFFMTLPSLAAPLLGVWVDRLPRRSVMIWGHLGSAVMVLPLLLVHDAADVWLIWAVAFLYGVSQVVLPAALNGVLKSLVADDALVDANSSLATTKEGLRLFGPLVGALLFAWAGGGAVAVLDAATFVVAAGLVATLDVDEPEAQRGTGFRDEALAGLRFIRDDRVLRNTAIGFAAAVLVIGFFEASIYAMLDAFDRPATWASGFVTVMGVGAIGGGLSASRVVRRGGEVGACAAGLVGMGLATAVAAVGGSLTVVFVGAGMLGFAMPVTFVALTTLQQRRSPAHLVGRVSTAMALVLGPPQAISLAVGSLLVSLIDYRLIFAIIAVTMVASAGQIALTLRDQLRPSPPEAAALIESR